MGAEKDSKSTLPNLYDITEELNKNLAGLETRFVSVYIGVHIKPSERIKHLVFIHITNQQKSANILLETDIQKMADQLAALTLTDQQKRIIHESLNNIITTQLGSDSNERTAQIDKLGEAAGQDQRTNLSELQQAEEIVGFNIGNFLSHHNNTRLDQLKMNQLNFKSTEDLPTTTTDETTAFKSLQDRLLGDKNKIRDHLNPLITANKSLIEDNLGHITSIEKLYDLFKLATRRLHNPLNETKANSYGSLASSWYDFMPRTKQNVISLIRERVLSLSKEINFTSENVQAANSMHPL